MPTHSGEGGFQALLRDAGLWDLVQMKCEARARCVVRVGSHGRSGYLYFAEGRIVHAILGELQGERAALEILGWSQGSWDPCERPWPAQAGITTAWQALLLQAAQRQDEARNAKHLTVVQAKYEAARAQDDKAATMQQGSGSVPPRREESGTSYRPDDFEHAVRMDAQGNVVSGHGRAEELAALSAYACRLADLVGELMGMGKLHALEASLIEGRCLIFRGQSGATVALKPRSEVDLTRLRNQLRL